MFGINKPYFLGVDFGTSYIKAVELTLRKGLPELVNYGSIEMSFTKGKDTIFPAQSPEKTIRDYLGSLLKKLSPLSRSINLALPGYDGLITLVELPMMDAKELEQAIQFEAHKYIPAKPEDIVFSWEILSSGKGRDDKENKKKTVDVLLVAALKKEIAKYGRYVEGLNFPIDLLEIEIFPLVRAIASDRMDSTLIVDIGSRATNLILVRNGDVRINRSLNTGGNEITSTLSEGLGISWERAEELKCGAKDFLTKPEAALTFSALELILSEITRMLRLYSEKDASESVKEIVLSGGTAYMQGLPGYFTKALHLPVSIANPWRNISCDETIRPILDKIGPSFVIATGLALGGVDQYRKK